MSAAFVRILIVLVPTFLISPVAFGQAPRVTDFLPTGGTTGTTVTLTGTNFLPTVDTEVSVRIGLVDAEILSHTDTELQITVPVGATTGAITVTTENGTHTTGRVFHVLFPLAGSVSLPVGLDPTDFDLVGTFGVGSLTGSSYSVSASASDDSIIAAVPKNGDGNIFLGRYCPDRDTSGPVIDAASTALALLLNQPFFVTDNPQRYAYLADLATGNATVGQKLSELEALVEEHWVLTSDPLTNQAVIDKVAEAVSALVDILPADSHSDLSASRKFDGRVQTLGTDWLTPKFQDGSPPGVAVAAPDGLPSDWVINVARIDPEQAALDNGLNSILALESTAFTRETYAQLGIVPAKQLSAKIDIVSFALDALSQSLIGDGEDPLNLQNEDDAIYILRMYSGAVIDTSPNDEDSTLMDAIDSTASSVATRDKITATALNLTMVVLDALSLFDKTGDHALVGQAFRDMVSGGYTVSYNMINTLVTDIESGAVSDTATIAWRVGTTALEIWKEMLRIKALAGLGAAQGKLAGLISKLWVPLEVLSKISTVGKIGERTAALLGTSLGPNVTPLESSLVLVGDPLAPKITSLNQVGFTLAPGDSLTLTGLRWWTAAPEMNKIWFDTTSAPGESLSGDDLTLTIPENLSPGTYTLAASSPRGGPRAFATPVTVQRRPLLQNRSPSKGFAAAGAKRGAEPFADFAGTPVTMHGSFFDPASDPADMVLFGETGAVISGVETTEITARVPAGLDPGPTEVSIKAGDSELASAALEFLVLDAPVLTAISPTEAKGFATLVLDCENLSGVLEEVVVRFGFTGGPVDVAPISTDDKRLTVRLPTAVPEGEMASVTVLTPAGASASMMVTRLAGLTDGTTFTVGDLSAAHAPLDGVISLGDAIFYADFEGHFIDSGSFDDENRFELTTVTLDDEDNEVGRETTLEAVPSGFTLYEPTGGHEWLHRRTRTVREGSGAVLGDTGWVAEENLDMAPFGTPEDGDLGIVDCGRTFTDTINVPATTPGTAGGSLEFGSIAGGHDILQGTGGKPTIDDTSLGVLGKGQVIKDLILSGGTLTIAGTAGEFTGLEISGALGKGIEITGTGHKVEASVFECSAEGVKLSPGAAYNELDIVSGGNAIGLTIDDATNNRVTGSIGLSASETPLTNVLTGLLMRASANANVLSLTRVHQALRGYAIDLNGAADNQLTVTSVDCTLGAKGVVFGAEMGMETSSPVTANTLKIGLLEGADGAGILVNRADANVIEDFAIEACGGSGILIEGPMVASTVLRNGTVGQLDAAGDDRQNGAWGISVLAADLTAIQDVRVGNNGEGGVQLKDIAATKAGPTLLQDVSAEGMAPPVPKRGMPTVGFAIDNSSGVVLIDGSSEGYEIGLRISGPMAADNQVYSLDPDDPSTYDGSTVGVVVSDGASVNQFRNLLVTKGATHYEVGLGCDLNQFTRCTATGEAGSEFGFHLTGASQTILNGCRVTGTTEAGLAATDAQQLEVFDFAVHQPEKDAMRLSGVMAAQIGSDAAGGEVNLSAFGRNGIHLLDCADISIRNTNVYGRDDGTITGVNGIQLSGATMGVHIGVPGTEGSVAVNGTSGKAIFLDNDTVDGITVRNAFIGALGDDFGFVHGPMTAGNTGYGIFSDGAASVIVGEPLGISRNTISDNALGNIFASGADGGISIIGNTIGDGPGVTPVFGIHLTDGLGLATVRDNLIEGCATGVLIDGGAHDTRFANNDIRDNTGDGVTVDGASTNHNSLRGNRITRNGGKAIRLVNGANDGIQAPTVTEVMSSRGRVQGNIPSGLDPGAEVHVFADPDDEGATLVGTDLPKNNRFITFSRIPVGMKITATVTDAVGNTSEYGGFSGSGAGSAPGLWVFASNRHDPGGEMDIYRFFAGESDPSRLVSNLEEDTRPRLAPNGTDIAWSARRSGTFQLHLRDGDGSETALTSGSGDKTDPAFTPDGSTLVYTSDASGNLDLMELDLAAPESPRVLLATPADEFEAVVAPGGNLVAYVSNAAGNADIVIANRDMSNPVAVTTHAAVDDQPAFSPDGGSLAFVSDRDGNSEIYRYDLLTGELTRLTESSGWDSDPVWTGLGAQLLIRANRGQGDEIYLLDGDSRALGRLTLSDGDNAFADAGIRAVGAPGITGQVTVNAVQGVPLELSLDHLTITAAKSAVGENRVLRVWDGDDYSRDGQTITPDGDFVGDLSVPVTVGEAGTPSNLFLLTVSVTASSVPIITAQPESADFCVGADLTLSITAMGSGTLSYQWRKDGQEIQGATSPSYSVLGVTEQDSGDYDCVVTSDGGSLTSDTATVTVEAFAVRVSPEQQVQGLAPIVVEAEPRCESGSVTWSWVDLGSGLEVGDTATYAPAQPLAVTTTFALTAADDGSGAEAEATATVLVAADSQYLDLNGDGCNTLADLTLLASQWSGPTAMEDDPSGDGTFDVLDLFYIRVDEGTACDTGSRSSP
ncbi:PD40 domain-containing protein [Sulfidibacter corallicola]|uniref:PD40 domain-containing protein n=1 Tax=Sulfidibacter corallicola TaxID=2818388 RepID=A0A8A4TP34_SULCO|nr:right-handed parallel beta-helix repeat-containing protein [Sulfidibacter corallicola]QTD51310.1 PD40 domain-containing protein [Sulfidibacter corallicola]